MTKLRAHNIAVSLDGFATGEGQSFETPFGHAGHRLMQWFLPTRTFVAMTGHEDEAVGAGTRGVDDGFAAASQVGIGAEIMGRRKFGPQTGPWQDESWRGWWGEEPPFHSPVVVLTHHARPDLAVGETTFLFRDLPPQEALALATEQAGGLDVRLSCRPTSSTTCTSSSCRSCSAAACASGTASRASRSVSTWRRRRRPPASCTTSSHARRTEGQPLG